MNVISIPHSHLTTVGIQPHAYNKNQIPQKYTGSHEIERLPWPDEVTIDEDTCMFNTV